MNGPPTGSPVCQGSTPAPSPNTITNRSAVARSRAPPSASAMPPAQTTHCVPKRSSRLILGLAAGAGGAGAAAGGSGPDGVGGASIFASGGSEAAGSASGVGAETGLGAGASPAVPARRVSREASLNSSLLTCSRVPSVSTMLTMASTGMAMTTAMRSPSMSISLAGGQRGWPGRWRTSETARWRRSRLQRQARSRFGKAPSPDAPLMREAYLSQGWASGEAGVKGARTWVRRLRAGQLKWRPRISLGPPSLEKTCKIDALIKRGRARQGDSS